MLTRRMLSIAAGGLAAAAGFPAGLASAQDARPDLARLKPAGFPSQPMEMTVVYPAGGGADLTARLLARTMEQISGDRILVNNRTGGAGMVGHAWLATQAPADGHVMGMLVNLVWGDAMLRAQGRWNYTDLEPIGYINSDPMIWAVTTDGPFKDMPLARIAEAAKEKPNTFRVATVPGSMWDYLIEQVEQNTGARFLKVPFQSGGAGTTALIGNNVDIAPAFFAELRPHIASGRVRLAAIAAAQRVRHLPDLPTFNEALGGTGYEWTLIRFVVVPKNVPADRKAYLSALVRQAMRDGALVEEYTKMGVHFDPALRDAADPAAALNAEAEKEREFYRRTGRLR
ncbi:tripartite tricarboxylate transporter substrate binding protein [Elioraea sp.]|uniref:tripartite tricarboxylate transporter substrate binding protein n=1 Tax=Elioraea sp. TaxID=2185103 RepID=UPI0025C0A41C|nr:tripartite tricarboxylate transporter substrate binding protein [Elioraea sp.]